MSAERQQSLSSSQVSPEQQEAADLLRTIVDGLPVLAWTATPEGGIDYVNLHWQAFAGQDAPSVIGDGWIQAVHPDDRDAITRTWAESLQSGQPLETELRLRRADGAWVAFLARAHAVRDASGQVVRWVGTSTEIEEHRRAEQALRESESSFREIVDSAPALMFTTTAAGELDFVNRQLLDYFALDLASLQQWRQSDSVHPDDLPETIAQTTRGFASGQPFGFEQRLRRADGIYRRVHFAAAPLLDERGDVLRWYGVINDIEDLKASEAQLDRARGQLSRARQIAAVSELAASIAQQIRQPLQDLMEAAERCSAALASGAPPPELARQLADDIARDARLAADSVRRIRGLFRLSSRHVPVDLAAMLGELPALLHAETTERGLALQMDLQQGLPAMAGDRVQLQQVVMDLARLAMGDAGPGAAHLRALQITLRLEGNRAAIRLVGAVVASDGGRAGHDAIQVAACRSIVQAHGGQLLAIGTASDGAGFALSLPCAGDAPPPPEH